MVALPRCRHADAARRRGRTHHCAVLRLGQPGTRGNAGVDSHRLTKPHTRVITRLHITLQIAREVLAKYGLDANIVRLVP